MGITEVSITALDYSKINSKTLREWLKLLGFNRYPIEYRLEYQIVRDLRYAHKFNPSGKRHLKGDEFPMMIVPYYHLNETMFLIRQSELDRLLDSLEVNKSVEEVL